MCCILSLYSSYCLFSLFPPTPLLFSFIRSSLYSLFSLFHYQFIFSSLYSPFFLPSSLIPSSFYSLFPYFLSSSFPLLLIASSLYSIFSLLHLFLILFSFILSSLYSFLLSPLFSHSFSYLPRFGLRLLFSFLRPHFSVSSSSPSLLSSFSERADKFSEEVSVTNRYSLPKKKNSRFKQTRYFYPMSRDSEKEGGGGGLGAENLDLDYEIRNSKGFEESQVVKCIGTASRQVTSLYLTLPYLTLPYLTLTCLILPYFTLPYFTLPYVTLPYLTLPYLILPYFPLP